MAYPKSSQVSPGNDALASQYNDLRDDALYPILQSFTYGETISVNDAVYLASDGKVYKTNASYNDERINNFIGFAKEAGNANDIKKVQIAGIVEGFSGLTTGSYYYLSNTAGGISSASGTYGILVGIAISSTKLKIQTDIDFMGVKLIASNNLRFSADSEGSTSSSSYVKVKSIKLIYGGTIRVKFDLKNTGGGTSYGIVRYNGIDVGTERFQTSDWFTFSEDIFVPPGMIELWVKVTTTFVHYRNFRIYYDKVKSGADGQVFIN
jgi:hypothetical protein